MSEAAAPAEAPAKKKGKLPIIIALVAVLAGGGFFMMKSKGAKKEKPAAEIVMGDVEVEIKDEFLCNMLDGRTYVRCKIALKLRKDAKPEEIEKHKGEISDAINLTLKATDPKATNTLDDMKKLKRKIAEAINSVLPAPHAEEEHKEEGHGKGKKTESVKLKPKKEEKDEHADEPEIPEDWDSLEGPVLKVLFLSFATQ